MGRPVSYIVAEYTMSARASIIIDHLYGDALLEIELRGLDKCTTYNLILDVIKDTF